MKRNETSRIVKNVTTGLYYKVFMGRNNGGHIYYTEYCLYDVKNKKNILKNWTGLGWYTSVSHALRGVRRHFAGEKIVLVK